MNFRIAETFTDNLPDPVVKEGKQAEFLVRTFVPWGLVRRIGMLTANVQNQGRRHMAGAAHRPVAEVCRAWYF